MNLWANRIGQLAMLAVALFFFSCQDEASVLGFRNPNSKFKVSYVEIPIESSVYLRDSLRTSNFSYSGEVNRFLVGNYADEAFGTITAAAYSQYFTASFAKLPSTAEFDSVSLQLRFDLYNYGSSLITPQTIGVYELDKALTADSLAFYFNKSSVPYSTMLGSRAFTIDPQIFKDFAASSTDYDTLVTVKVPLEASFGQRIFDSAIRYRDAASKEDSAFVYYNEFVKEFKGIVIRPENADKIVGFNPAAPQTVLLIHYHTDDADSLSFGLTLTGVIGFNQIKADRTTSDLSALGQPYETLLPASDNRYIESGVGIFTKLDFSKFYEFADTVPNMLINSAELVIESVQPSGYAPPLALSLRVLKDNNRMKKYSSLRPQDATDYLSYRGYLLYDVATQNGPPVVDNDSVFYGSDNSPLLSFSSAKNSYNGSLTLFFQQLAIDDTKTKFRNFVLYPFSQAATASAPVAQSAAKSVNRVIFPENKIKLKIFYTKPTTAR